MICSQHSHLFSGKLRKTEDALALVTDPGLVLSVVWIWSSWEAKLLSYHAALPLCKGRLRHSTCAALPTHIRFLVSACEPHWKANQIPSNIATWCSLSEIEVQETIPCQNWNTQVTPNTKTNLFASQTRSLPQFTFKPAAFWVWTSQKQMTARSLPVILEFPKAQLLSN